MTTARLFEVTAKDSSFSDFALLSEGPLKLCKDAAGGCELQVGKTGLSLPKGCTIATCDGPYEHSTQWTLLSGDTERVYALLLSSPAEERHARQALICGFAIQFDVADAGGDEEEPAAASEEGPTQVSAPASAPAAAGKLTLKDRAKAKAGKIIDRALDDGRTAERIEAGGQAAAQGILKGAQKLGEKIHQAGDAGKRHMTPSEKEFVAGPRTQAGLDAAEKGAAVALRATEAIRSACFYGIKAAGRVTSEQVRKTSAFKKLAEEGDGGGGGGSERGARAAEAGAAVVTACLGVMYASRRGARIVVGDAKETMVDVTQHKKGEAAGAAARQALDAVDSLGMAAFNISNLVTSPESLAFELSAEAADSTLSAKEWFGGDTLHGGLLKRRSNLTLRLGGPLLVLLRPKSLAAYVPPAGSYWGQAEAASHDVGPEQAPCVVVPVDDMELVTAVGTEAGAWPQFEVRTRDQVLHRFAAIDAATRQGWIDVLGRMIAEVERVKGLDVQAALTAPGASGKS